MITSKLYKYFALFKAAQETYSNLDQRLFSSYIEQKSDPILGAMEPNMYSGGFSWKGGKQATGVRNYLKEIIMSTIEVHAEVKYLTEYSIIVHYRILYYCTLQNTLLLYDDSFTCQIQKMEIFKTLQIINTVL